MSAPPKSALRSPCEPFSRQVTKRTKLTPASKTKTKAAAKRAGRRYPNLIDNMNAARQQREAQDDH